MSRFAEVVGVSKAYLSQIESGTSKNPSITTIIKYANYFNTTIDDIVYGSTFQYNKISYRQGAKDTRNKVFKLLLKEDANEKEE